MPSKGTPPRTIRVPDTEWMAAGVSVAAIGSDLSTEVRATLHELATRRIKEIRMPNSTTTDRCTWQNPCRACDDTNTRLGIQDPSVVHNAWVLVPARTLTAGDTVRDIGEADREEGHMLGTVTGVSEAGAVVEWGDGERVAYRVTGRSVNLLRALREGELTFAQKCDARA